MGSRDVIGHVTIRLPEVNFIWVVRCDHASILHRYGDIAPQILDARTWTRKDERRKTERKRGKGREGKREVEREMEGKGRKMEDKRKGKRNGKRN